MKKPYPPSGKCPECNLIVGGTASQPNTWYCDRCKKVFGEGVKEFPQCPVDPQEALNCESCQ